MENGILIEKLKSDWRLYHDPSYRHLKFDIDIIKAAIDGGLLMIDIPKEFSSDKDLILYALNNNVPDLEQFIDVELFKDSEFMNELIERGMVFTEREFEYTKDHFQFLIRSICAGFIDNDLDNLILKSLPENYDIEFVFNSIKINSLAIKYFGSNYRNDVKLAHLCVVQNFHSFNFFSYNIRNDKSLVMTYIQEFPQIFQYVSEDLKADFEVASIAIANDKGMAAYICGTLSDNRQLALIAVKKSGANLKYFSDELRDDKELVLAAISKSYGGIIYASERLTNDLQVAKLAMRKNKLSFNYLSNEMKNNSEIISMLGRN